MKKKKIRQLTIDGRLITEYKDLRTAAKATKISKNNIYSVVMGKTKYAGGYIWEYREYEDNSGDTIYVI